MFLYSDGTHWSDTYSTYRMCGNLPPSFNTYSWQTAVADHLIQSFIRPVGTSFIWHDNVRSGTVGDRQEGWCVNTFKLIYVSSGQRTLASVEGVSHVRERCGSGSAYNGDQLIKI
jgi:hypothetical protein